MSERTVTGHAPTQPNLQTLPASQSVSDYCATLGRLPGGLSLPISEIDTYYALVSSTMGKVAKAFGDLAATLMSNLGPRADGRRRPRRIAKKLVQRGGFRRHDSIGTMLAKLRDVEEPFDGEG